MAKAQQTPTDEPQDQTSDTPETTDQEPTPEEPQPADEPKGVTYIVNGVRVDPNGKPV